MHNGTHLKRIFDQLLLEMETAGFEDAILLLAGTLDGALAMGVDVADLSRTLLSHPIAEFLEPQLKRNSTPFRDFSENNLWDANRLPAETGNFTIIKKLNGAVSKLSIDRSEKLREQLTSAALADAFRFGKSVCLLGRIGAGTKQFLTSCSKGKVTCLNTLENVEARNQLFERIIAPCAADQMCSKKLQEFMTTAFGLLSESGSLFLSSFTPNHVGMGWKIICEQRLIKCHRSEELAAYAAASGFSFSQFHDASGSLAWAEMKRVKANRNVRGTDAGR